MKAIVYRGRPRAKWLALVMMCALATALTPSAHAQQSLGTVLSVPIWEVGTIWRLNVVRQFNVVHISQVAVGNQNVQVATVAVDQKNASKLKVPRSSLNIITQLNVNVTIINQFAFGSGNVQTAEVKVNQSNRA